MITFGMVSCTCKMDRPETSRLFPHTAFTSSGKTSAEASPATNTVLLNDYPIIDIHTHTFNALYLPVMNIARGRTRELPFGWTLSESVAVVLANGIIGKTLENQADDNVIREQKSKRASLYASGTIASQLGITAETVEEAASATLSAQKGVQFMTKDIQTLLSNKTLVNQIITNDRNWIRFGERVFGIDPEVPPGTSQEKALYKKAKLVAFLDVLTSNDAAIRQQIFTDYNGRVTLFVHHTMDMGRTYAQEPDGLTFKDFLTHQLSRVRELDRATVNNGRFLHFVAFNPFRSEREEPVGGWKNSIAIKEIDLAIKNGAWGVKYYPPAGYRPSGNKIPRRPTFGRLPQAQWDSRYAGFTNEELNQLNLAFFEYCAQNDIPIFAHCNYGEFQAASCYGERMANPAYYREVLEYLTNRPTPLHLRLCLGHAGGADFWFGDNDASHKEWGAQVFELCTRFPNVYCEVGILSEILQSNERKIFAERLAVMFNPSIEPERYNFAKKIMYGSDWFMPDAAGATVNFLEEYQKTFLGHSTLAPYYKDFFCLNALAFLGISPESPTIKARVSLEVQNQLDPLVRQSQH